MQYQRRREQTISAQVIDTIVEWIDDNLHQPLRIDDIARRTGIRNGICNGCLQYKGSLGALYSQRKLLLAARDLRDTDQRVYDICLKYGFDSQQTFTRVFTGPSICRRAYRREPQSRPLRRPSGLAFERKPATPHLRSTRYSMAPSARTTNKTRTYKAG